MTLLRCTTPRGGGGRAASSSPGWWWILFFVWFFSEKLPERVLLRVFISFHFHKRKKIYSRIKDFESHCEMHSFPPLSRRRNVEMLTVVQRAAGWPSEFDKFTSEQLRQHWRPQELKHRNRRSSNPQMNNSRFFILFFILFSELRGSRRLAFSFLFFFFLFASLNCLSSVDIEIGISAIDVL